MNDPNPNLYPNTTQFPNEVLRWWVPEVSGSEAKALCYIVGKTYGFGKTRDGIPVSQMLEGTRRGDGTLLDPGIGLARPTMFAALDSLENRGMIVRLRSRNARGHKETTVYGLNMAHKTDRQRANAPSAKNETRGRSNSETGVGKKTRPGVVSEFDLSKPTEHQNLSTPPNPPDGEDGSRDPSGAGASGKGKGTEFGGKTQEEYREMVMEVVNSDPLGQDLMSLIQLAAAGNQTGKMSASRAWNQFAGEYVKHRDLYPEEAWRYGFQEALKAEATHFGYVKNTARRQHMKTGADAGGFSGKSPEQQAEPATPEPALRALRDHAELSRFVGAAKAFDFTGEEDPPFKVLARLGGDEGERQTILKRMRSVCRRAVRQAKEVG